MTERKWLAECHAWLDDPESVQYKTDQGNWHQPADGKYTPIRHPYLTWRLKPKTITITINGEEFEAPVPPIQNLPQPYIVIGERMFFFLSHEARDAVYKKLVEVLTC